MPNYIRSSLGEWCEAMARVTLPEARAIAQLVRDELGVAPVPVVSYQTPEVPSYSLYVPVNLATGGMLWSGGFAPNYTAISGIFGPRKEDIGRVIKYRRITLLNPGSRTVAGPVTVQFLSHAKNQVAGDSGGNAGTVMRHNANGPASLFWDNGAASPGTAISDSAAPASLVELFRTDIWIPGAAGPFTPISWDLSMARGLESLTDILGPTNQAGTISCGGLTIKGPPIAGQAGMSWLIDFIELPKE